MPRAKGTPARDLLPTVPCSGQDEDGNACQNRVRQRRPSATGEHYCSEKSCQRAKARSFYQRRNATIAVDQEKELVLFLAALRSGAAATCEACGRRDAVPGWIHPLPDRYEPCPMPARGLSFARGSLQIMIIQTLFDIEPS